MLLVKRESSPANAVMLEVVPVALPLASQPSRHHDDYRTVLISGGDDNGGSDSHGNVGLSHADFVGQEHAWSVSQVGQNVESSFKCCTNHYGSGEIGFAPATCFGLFFVDSGEAEYF